MGYMGNAGNASGITTIVYSSGTGFLTGQPYAGIGGASNPDLKWEDVRVINGGIEFSLLKNRIQGSLELYQKKSTDLIADVPFDPTTGVSLYTVNSASLKGNGIDLSLNTNVNVRDFRWNVGYGISYNKTIITKLYNGGFRASDFIAYGLNAGEGQLANGISSYRWAGLDPATGDPMGILNGIVSKDYSKIFNDSLQNQIFNGSAVPLYSGFFNNVFSWQNFSLSLNISYRFGFYFRKPALDYGELFSEGAGHEEYTRRWQKTGDERFTNVPSMIYPIPINLVGRDSFYGNSEINVLRGDNIRLQDIRFQYNWNNSRSPNIPFTNAQVFVYLNNINKIIWRKDKSNWDSDFTGGGNKSLWPTPTTITFGAILHLK
jgi:hypothetical protein